MAMNNSNFQLSFPDEWKETTVFTFEGPYDSGIQHNLIVTILPGQEKGCDLQGFAKSQTMSNAAMLPGFQLISEKEVSFYENIPGYEIVYKYCPADEIQFFQKQWYFIVDKKIYLFTSTFNKKTIKTIALEVEEIIKSLQTQLSFE